jgi:N-acetylmuramoyl-L-alanine amidase CwlA
VVRTIQEALKRAGYSLVADGVYGKNTAEAVRAFQKANGLTADGIVGAKTLERLQDESSLDCPIMKGYIYSHITYFSGRALKYIAIHYTAGRSSKRGAAMSVRNVFMNRNASADFVVDDEQIVQINPDIKNYYCWAVGDKKNMYCGGGRLYGVATNKNTISIEICSNLKAGTSAAIPNHEGWYFTEAALDNAVKLVRHLMKTYGIQKGNVIRHYDVTGKLCPKYYAEHEDAWEQFKVDLDDYIEEYGEKVVE